MNEMGLADRSTAKERLMERKKWLLLSLNLVNQAIELLEKEPAFEEVFRSVERGIYGL